MLYDRIQLAGISADYETSSLLLAYCAISTSNLLLWSISNLMANVLMFLFVLLTSCLMPFFLYVGIDF